MVGLHHLGSDLSSIEQPFMKYSIFWSFLSFLRSSSFSKLNQSKSSDLFLTSYSTLCLMSLTVLVKKVDRLGIMVRGCQGASTCFCIIIKCVIKYILKGQILA